MDGLNNNLKKNEISRRNLKYYFLHLFKIKVKIFKSIEAQCLKSNICEFLSEFTKNYILKRGMCFITETNVLKTSV